MKRSNRLVILVGVLLAALAFVGIVVFLNQRAAPVTEVDDRVEVLVARQDIAISDEVTPDMVEIVKVDLEDVSGSALGDPSLLRNRTALTAVPAGAQVSAEVFGTLGNTDIDIAAQLQAGERAMAFQVDNVTGLGFLLKQGDIIDIIVEQRLSVNEAAEEGGPTAVVPGLESASTVKTVLQAKRVLYVSDSRLYAPPAPAEGEAAPPAAQFSTVLVVIAGTSTDAELIKFAQRDAGQIGTITVALRAVGDEAIAETTGITLDALVAEYGVRIPNVVLADE